MSKQITANASVTNQLFLFSLSTTAGIFSYRLLPSIGSKLEKQFIEQKMVQTEQKVINIAVDYTSAISHAETALIREGYHDAPQAIERLEAIKHLFPTNRTLYIYLGRLYRKMKNYDKAIISLREFIENLEQKRIKIGDKGFHQYEIDRSDAYFNIACYHILKAEENMSKITQDEVNRLKNETIEALKISIKIWAQNKEYAKNDPDFRFIKEDKEYQHLISG